MFGGNIRLSCELSKLGLVTDPIPAKLAYIKREEIPAWLEAQGHH
jgi:hypothetical protein